MRALEAMCAQASALQGRCLRQGDEIAHLQALLRAAEVQHASCNLLLVVQSLHWKGRHQRPRALPQPCQKV